MKKQGILFKYLWKYKFRYLFGLMILLIVDYLNLSVPKITGELIDGLTLMSLDVSGLIQLVVSLLGVCALIAIGRIFWRFFIFGTSRNIERLIRNDLFEKLEQLSQNYFNAHKTGDLMAHFTNDLEALRVAIGPAIISSFDAVVMTVMTLYRMMMYVDVKLTLLTLIPMSVIAVGGYYFGEVFEKRFSKKQEAFAKMSDHVNESISAERVIKAFVQEKKQDEAFGLINKNNLKYNMEVVKLMASVFPLLEFVIGASYVITIIYGGYLAITAQITLGRFIAFNQYLGMLVWPMIALGDSITSFSQGRAAVARMNQVFNEIPEIVDDEHPDDVKSLTGSIEISNVTFRYAEHLPAALKNITVSIKQGETLAILGRTGDGKTTLVNLLLRLYDIKEGQISFDGHDIKKIPLKVLRESIAYVPQDSMLFSDTISRNIAFGKHHATMEEIMEAAKDACVHDNIIDFPDQYETIVGERGVTLSGGQKQRCAIARALLKDSSILILDDSLSAVDTDTENQILANLKKRRKDKTTIMIAHRVSTVRNADHILLLDEGSIAEYGTFDELVQLGGSFAQMVEKQRLEEMLKSEEVDHGSDC